MQLKELPDLSRLDVQHDHSFLFDAHNEKRSQLITRWRGTVVERMPRETVVTAWQKSIYHFGGLDREVPILVTLLLEHDGTIRTVTIDEQSRGSQGKRCDFPCLERLTASLLQGGNIADLQNRIVSAGDVNCLHLFEILSGAATFYATLSAEDRHGSEQELLFISPDRNGLTAENVHEICGTRDCMQIRLTHSRKPVLNAEKLCDGADADVSLRYNGKELGTERVQGDSFELVFASLNRLFSKCQLQEKRYFGLRGRMKHSNYPSMTGLFLLSFSHGGMRGGPGKALQIERILHYLQTGYHKQPCKGFSS